MFSFDARCAARAAASAPTLSYSGSMAAADEMTSVLHLARMFGDLVAYEIAEALDLPVYDNRWVTPAGIDVTDLCDRSDTGGFGSVRWTLKGWVLDQYSLALLRAEYPDATFD